MLLHKQEQQAKKFRQKKVLPVFKTAVRSTAAFIMSPTLSSDVCLVSCQFSSPVIGRRGPTNALIGQNPPHTEARLVPGFVCTVYKCTGVQNIGTAV